MAQQSMIIETFPHLGRQWAVVRIKDSFYARDDHDVDVGPYGTVEEARDWVLSIVPA